MATTPPAPQTPYRTPPTGYAPPAIAGGVNAPTAPTAPTLDQTPAMPSAPGANQAPAAPTATASGTGANAVAATTPTTQTLKFAGIDPTQQRTGVQTLQDLEKILGAPLSADQRTYAMKYLNYTDPTGAAMLSGTDYNRLMEHAAQLAGGQYDPWKAAQATGGTPTYPTEGPLGPDPFVTPHYEDAPAYQAPRYQQQTFKAPSWEELQNDPGYQFRRKEGMGALQAGAAARGMLGTGTFGRDIMNYGQELASQEYQNAYNRSAQTFGINQGERQFGYNADTGATQAEYAPRLLTWNARRDDGQRAAELTYDRNWQREQRGRDDAYKYNRAGEDDYRYRDNRDEMRKRFLAELGQQ